MPNIAIITDLKERFGASDSPEILYFGTRNGMEKSLVASLNIRYKGIFCGKLRRYFSWQNFIDFFKLPVGIVQAFFALLRFRPQAVFCKGGYVSFPVAVASWMLRIPVVLHESDVIPGLANKLSSRFSRVICVSFPETKKYFPDKKVIVTGNPVRREIISGNREDGKSFAGLKEDLPVILVMGGSLGAEAVNNVIFALLNKLVADYQIVHICGERQANEGESILKKNHSPFASRYTAFGFIGEKLKDIYAMSDIIVSRAGANSLAEIALVGKRAILIPLGKNASRGDQIENARVFAASHPAIVMEESAAEKNLIPAIKELLQKSAPKHAESLALTANEKIIEILLNLTKS
jgi:UDP-N-acetylglucosamine--N-acetylmuramyl-(pentapeptide) pyrophosphoryl-undecaprenol N-acetylglucosamine transferase